MRKYTFFFLILIFFSSCREIGNFIIASVDLFGAFLEWMLILIVGGFILALVIGLIRQILGLNNNDK